MPSALSALFWGVITFSVLIVIHEGGHFLAARAFGVKVHEFMVGLPGPALKLHGPKTTYGITAIPLGGYVRIAGMEPGPEDPLLGPVLSALTRLGEGDAFEVAALAGTTEADAERVLLILADWDAVESLSNDEYRFRSRFDTSQAGDPGLLDKARSTTYRSLSFPKRVVLLTAGVVLNLLTAIVVLTVLFSSIGIPRQSTVIEGVEAGSAADAARILPGDRIVAIDGGGVSQWYQVQRAISGYEPGQAVTVTLERGGKRLDASATLKQRSEGKGAVLGVLPVTEFIENPTILQSIGQSFIYIGFVFDLIAGFLNPSTFQGTVNQSSSIIGASYMAADAARDSALAYASLVAALSLSLGVINVFPIPPLDGGKVAIEIVERISGRPLSRRLSLGLSSAGTLLLFVLIGYLMYADVTRYILQSG